MKESELKQLDIMLQVFYEEYMNPDTSFEREAGINNVISWVQEEESELNKS